MYHPKLFTFIIVAALSGLSTAHASTPPSYWPTLDGRDVGVRTWDTAEIDLVRIEMTSGKLRLAGGADLATHIADIDGPSACSVRMYTEERVLHISVAGDSGQHAKRCVVELAMSVPAEIGVEMQASAASVDLWQLRSSLTVRGSTPRLRGTYRGEDLEVVLTSGKVHLNGLRAAPHVHTGQGPVRLRFDEPPTEDVYAHSDKGRVSVNVPDGDGIAVIDKGGARDQGLPMGETRTIRTNR